MPKFIITWDAGCGGNWEEVEAENRAEAEKMARQAWQEEAESEAKYEALPWTEENCDNYDLEYDGEDDD